MGEAGGSFPGDLLCERVPVHRQTPGLGFTDDGACHLIGLGASAIGSFPGPLIQNEKNAGRYRMCIGGIACPPHGGDDPVRSITSDRGSFFDRK